MKNLVIIQTVVPDYRKGFFNAIENALDQHFELYGGDFYFEKSVKSDCKIPKKNIFLKFTFGILCFMFSLKKKLDNLLIKKAY